MVKLRERRRSGFIVLLLLLCAALCFTFTAVFATEGGDPAPAAEEIFLGQVVETERTLSYGGEQKQAEVRITAPDGGVFTGKQFTADAAGKWSVVYSADFNGHTVTEREEYLCVLRPVDILEGNSAATVANGAFSLDESAKGLSVEFRSGGAVTFTQFADLSGKTKEDALLSLLVDPSEQGKTDFTMLTVTLTDVHDPSNAITVTIEDAGEVNCDGRASFVRAAATGQTAVGINVDDIRKGTGTEIRHSFRGWPQNAPLNILSLYYDEAENALYSSVAWDYRSPSTTLVADFDDAAFFPGAVWGGFTTGEVEIRVAAGGMTAVSAKVLFTEVMGYDLSAEKYTDTSDPVITVDYGGERTVPSGYAGATYPLFAASAKDAQDGILPVSVQVYYENSQGDRTDATVADGAFRIDYIGTYVIRYEATDAAGNTAFEEVRVLSVSQKTPLSLTVPDIAAQMQVYDRIELPSAADATAAGGTGVLHVVRTVKDPDGNEVELAGNSFRPDMLGQYTVTYTVTDYVGDSTEKTVTIDSQPGEKPIFVETPILPEVLIAGFTYDLPDVPAVETVSGDMTAAEVRKFVNGTQVTGGSFTAGGSSVTIRYDAVGQTGTTPYEVTIPVVEANGGRNLTAYFHGTFAAAQGSSGVELTSAGEAAALFANSLGRSSFSLEFFAGEYADTLKNFTVTLQDSADPSNTVSLHINYAPDGTVTLENGGTSVTLTAQGDRHRFLYTNETRGVADEYGSGVLTIAQNDLGQPFGGFAGRVWLRISAEESGTVTIARINNQSFGSSVAASGDRIQPIVWFENALSVKQLLGTTIEVAPGEASDVLSDIASFTVTVTDPDGDVRVSGAADTAYELTFDKYGQWNVVYTAVDSAGMTSSSRKMYRVNETEAPVLSVNTDSLSGSYSVGDGVAIPSYTVSDNSGAYTLDIYLLLPDNQMRLLVHEVSGNKTSYLSREDDTYPSSFKVDENTFRAETAGSYTLIFFAYDEAYNCTTVKADFTAR